MRISDWSSDVCSSDLLGQPRRGGASRDGWLPRRSAAALRLSRERPHAGPAGNGGRLIRRPTILFFRPVLQACSSGLSVRPVRQAGKETDTLPSRSEEHTSELQSLMRIPYAVFCLKK